jgi:hypothetical protein
LSAIKIPVLCLVTLVGVSGSGKSTFASKPFLSTEVISSDFCRGLVSDDENDQAATKAAFEVLHFITGKRLEGGRLTVVDATNVQPEARSGLLKLARTFPNGYAPIATQPEKTASSDPRFYVISSRNCSAPFEAYVDRGFTVSTFCPAKTRSRRPRSSVSHSGTTVGRTTVPSTSSVTLMAVMTSWSSSRLTLATWCTPIIPPSCHRRAGGRYSSGTWSTEVPPSPLFSAS